MQTYTHVYIRHTKHTDMYYVSLFSDHNIPIVPVLDLQQVSHQRICRHAVDKVGPCLYECICTYIYIAR